jgi:DNA repair and recombination protein RAD54B
MGSIAWKGDTLSSGYTLFISGKEVQLDSQVKKSQLPTIDGTLEDSGADSIGESKGLQELMVPQKASSSAPLSSTGMGISPALFYATPMKKKHKGPLSVKSLECKCFPLFLISFSQSRSRSRECRSHEGPHL